MLLLRTGADSYRMLSRDALASVVVLVFLTARPAGVFCLSRFVLFMREERAAKLQHYGMSLAARQLKLCLARGASVGLSVFVHCSCLARGTSAL